MLKKRILKLQFDCDPNLYIIHDKKWTSEAIFNILDNAVNTQILMVRYM
uniref:Two-component sensor histidine kinase n=1 Tax=Clostridioides difficile TaxID=1496 RepID=A0A381IBD8_CLODI|nr:two-component sensor histidine kinase [Clostridioides difficile]